MKRDPRKNDQLNAFGVANCVAWLRKGNEEHDGCVTVICNGKEQGMKKVDVGKDHAGEKWTDVMGWSEGEITIDEGELSSTHLNWGPS